MRELLTKRHLNILQRGSVDEIKTIKDHLEEMVLNGGNDCVEYSVLGSVHYLIDLIFGGEELYEDCVKRSKEEWIEITRKLRESEVQ
jgi:hypothetical protein